MKLCNVCIFLVLTSVLAGVWCVTLQAQKPNTGDAGVSPDYPRVNLAATYMVDAAWPQKPADYQWAAVSGVAVDKQDRVWIFTRATPPIQVYTPAGKLVRAWGEDSIKTAHHLKIDEDGNIWVADIGLHVVRKFSPQGELLLTIGTPGESGNDTARMDKPTDMAIAPNGHVYVSDGYGNNRIVHFDAEGNYVSEWGELGTGPKQFSLPHAIDIDAQGRLYVADRNNVRVCVYSQAGEMLDLWEHKIVPWGFCVTPADEIWVCGSSPMPWRNDPDYPGAPLGCPPKDQVLMRFDTDGELQQLWTIPKGMDGKEQPGDVNWIHAMALDSQGNIYVGDIIGKRAQKFERQ